MLGQSRSARVARRLTVLLVAVIAMAFVPSQAHAADLDRFLNLPLVNRDAAHGPGGVHPALPTDQRRLQGLLTEARSRGEAPTSYAALLYQYWLVRASDEAHIDLAHWNPRTGARANRDNLIKSYRYYENFQLSHRELQWAGMGGMVGADFGGGLLDFELFGGTMDIPAIQQAANAVVRAVDGAAGPQAVAQLPEGLRALAGAGAVITGADLHYLLGMILVMQKNIFSDLMPMHAAYVAQGLPALAEMRSAGLFSEPIMDAWRDVASREKDRVARGNATLLRREQETIVKDQWDSVRAYRGDVGLAVTYLATVAGSPSVAGVVPPRQLDPIVLTGRSPSGSKVRVTTFLPSWNWSVFPERWAYISGQLLPKYTHMVNDEWPTLRAQLVVPYETQLESHRPIANLPQLLQSIAGQVKVQEVR